MRVGLQVEELRMCRAADPRLDQLEAFAAQTAHVWHGAGVPLHLLPGAKKRAAVAAALAVEQGVQAVALVGLRQGATGALQQRGEEVVQVAQGV